MFIATKGTTTVKCKNERNGAGALISYAARIILCIWLAFTLGCGTTPQQKQQDKPALDAAAGTEAAPGELSPIDQTQYQQALDQLEAGEVKAALKTLKKLDNKVPNHMGVKVNLATAYYQSGDFDAARKITTSAEKLTNVPSQLHNIAGLLYVEEKKFKQAEAAYQNALRQKEDYASAHYNIALLYDVYYQDIAKAYTHYLRYLALVGDDQATKDWVEQLKYSLD